MSDLNVRNKQEFATAVVSALTAIVGRKDIDRVGKNALAHQFGEKVVAFLEEKRLDGTISGFLPLSTRENLYKALVKLIAVRWTKSDNQQTYYKKVSNYVEANAKGQVSEPTQQDEGSDGGSDEGSDGGSDEGSDEDDDDDSTSSGASPSPGPPTATAAAPPGPSTLSRLVSAAARAATNVANSKATVSILNGVGDGLSSARQTTAATATGMGKRLYAAAGATRSAASAAALAAWDRYNAQVAKGAIDRASRNTKTFPVRQQEAAARRAADDKALQQLQASIIQLKATAQTIVAQSVSLRIAPAKNANIKQIVQVLQDEADGYAIDPLDYKVREDEALPVQLYALTL